MKKKIFISYSDKDRNKMRSLEKLIGKSGHLTPLIIANNRQPLVQLSEKVKSGILDCDYFIPILTRNSISNQWVNQEIGFAAAHQKKTIPIVENQILSKLKGFIHKGLDISYRFGGNRKSTHSEASKFSKSAAVLITDILVENEIIPKDISIESLFPGKWKSVYILPDGRKSGDDIIEIREGNKYYVKGKHWFNLESIVIDIKHKEIKFRKVAIPPDNRTTYDELKIIEIGKKYEGFEDKNTPIVYFKIE